MLTDWSKLLLEIRNKNLTMAGLARNIRQEGLEVHENTLKALLNGDSAQPRADLGERILKWHKKLTETV